MQYEAFEKIVASILLLIVISSLALAEATLWSILVGYASIVLIITIIDLIVINRRYPLLRSQLPDIRTRMKDALRESWPIGAIAVFTILYFRIDVVMLSFMDTQRSVGYYSAAYRISELITTIPAIFLPSIFPFLARYAAVNVDRLQRAYSLAAKYLLIISLALAFIFYALAPWIVVILYGEAFRLSIGAFRILLIASSLMFLTMLFVHMFISIGRQRLNMRITIVSVLLNISLNVLLIPLWSFSGAAISTVCTELFVLITGIVYLAQSGYTLSPSTHALRPLLIFSISILFFILVTWFTHAIVGVAVFIVCYLLGTYLFQITNDDRTLFFQLIRRDQSSSHHV